MRRINRSGAKFLHDGVNRVQELSGSTVTANLLPGLSVDETFARTDSAGVRDLVTDALGNTGADGQRGNPTDAIYLRAVREEPPNDRHKLKLETSWIDPE